MNLKIAVLHCLRLAGVFALCRRLTRSKLRILCYHGFAIGDQHEYNPMLYMKPRTFEARLKALQRLGYPVVSLQRSSQRRDCDHDRRRLAHDAQPGGADPEVIPISCNGLRDELLQRARHGCVHRRDELPHVARAAAVCGDR